MKSATQTSTKNRKQRYLRTLISAALLSTWMLPAMADGTAAGTTIDNTAYGSFENPSDPGNVIDVDSNTVRLMISEVAGITVTNQGVAEAPGSVTGAGPAQGDNVIGSEDVVYFTYRITNVGNDQTQFFIPDAPAGVTNATFGAGGPIEIVGYSANGTDVDPLSIPVTAGAATGTFAGIPNGGSVPVDGFIDVRVPVKADANLTPGTDEIVVVLGNTVSQDAADQNVELVPGGAFGAGNDVFTQDNPGTDNGDLAGSPAFEREASSSQLTAVGAAELDYGDAPDAAAGTATGDYETAPGRGPSHVVGSIFLGTDVDAETTDSEDDGPPLEDDGVEINDGAAGTVLHGEELIAGQQYTLDVTTVGAGSINAWIDFNQDGDFDDANEQIATDLASTGGTESIVVDVPLDAVAGSSYARFRYSSQTGLDATGAAPDGEVEDYEVTLVSASPALKLVKRVTSIGGTAITTVNDDTNDTNDDAANWPVNYLQGDFASTAAPGDTVDYTIYFLSDGNTPINNVRLCDLVPENTTYVPGSLQLSQGAGASVFLTDGAGDDAGESFAFGATPGAPCDRGTNTDGGVLVQVPGNVDNATAPGTPAGSYGFMRFTVTVD